MGAYIINAKWVYQLNDNGSPYKARMVSILDEDYLSQ
jgi:hypothetical protein